MRGHAILVALLALIGCGPKVPELARDLPSTYAEGEKVFDARLKARFPVGSDGKSVAEQLTLQGFEVRETEQGGSAHFNNRAFPVSSVWNIGWKAHDGRVAEIWGIYGGRGP